MKTVLIIALIINLAWSWYLSTQLKNATALNRSTVVAAREDSDTLNNEIRRLNQEADDLSQQLAECQTDAVGLKAELTEAIAEIERLEEKGTHAEIVSRPPVPGTIDRAEIEKRERVADLMIEISTLKARLAEMQTREQAVESEWRNQTGIRTSDADKNIRRAAMRNAINNVESVLRHTLAELYQLDPTAHAQVNK